MTLACAQMHGALAPTAAIHGKSIDHGQETLWYAVRQIFEDAQHSLSSHRHLAHALLRLFRTHTESNGDEGEREFLTVIIGCVNVVLALRKGEESIIAGRLLKFIFGFVAALSEADEEAAIVGTTPTTRFIERLMLYALSGVDAKDRYVRTRLCQIMVSCLNSIDEISDAVWEQFHGRMSERLYDREASVRVQAVLAMARLQSVTIDNSSLTIRDMFVDLLQHDPSAEVRKTVLSVIDVSLETLPVILERRLDTDSSVRTYFYGTKAIEEIDLKFLTIAQRDAILKSGLNDRDPVVKDACAKMIWSSWIQKTCSNLIEFLSCLDVMRDGSVGEEILLNFFERMQDGQFGAFTEEFFQCLTIETAFLLRIYSEFVLTSRSSDSLQELLPDTIVMAAHVARIYQGVCASNNSMEQEFILTQLLKTSALMAAFADEAGRRSMLEIAGEILCNSEITESAIEAAVLLLFEMSSTVDCKDSGEFLGMIGAIVADFRDVYEDGNNEDYNQEVMDLRKSLDKLSLSKTDTTLCIDGEIKMLANVRCLQIIKGALSLLFTADLQSVDALLNEVVLPAISSPFAVVQKSGLECLGLLSSFDKRLAVEHGPLFVEFYRQSSEVVRLSSLKILFDLLLLYGTAPFENKETRTNHVIEAIAGSLYSPSSEIQAIAAEGFAKLLLHQIIHNSVDSSSEPEEILAGLLQLYFHQNTVNSLRMKQALSYFLHTFSACSAENRQMLAKVSVRVLIAWIGNNDGKSHQPPPSKMTVSTVAMQLVHLIGTLPRSVSTSKISETTPTLITNPFETVALDICFAALASPTGHGRHLLSLLPKLPIMPASIENPSPATVAIVSDPLQIKQLLYLVGRLLKLANVNGDKSAATALKKFVATLVELDDTELAMPAEMIASLQQRISESLIQ